MTSYSHVAMPYVLFVLSFLLIPFIYLHVFSIVSTIEYDKQGRPPMFRYELRAREGLAVPAS